MPYNYSYWLKRIFRLSLVGTIILGSMPALTAEESGTPADQTQNVAQESPAAAPAQSQEQAPPATGETPAAPAVQTPVTPAEHGAPSGAEYIGAEVCLTCHEQRGDFKDNIHAKAWPKTKGIEFSKSCETCHGAGSLHAAAAGNKEDPGYATIKDPKNMSAREASATCLKCHENGKQAHWMGSTHESHGLSCGACHSSHAGHDKNLSKAEVTKVCFECHKDVQAMIQRTSHHPIKEGKMQCADCHNPHGTVGPSLMVNDSVTETCFKCHAEKRGPFLFEHRPVSENCADCHIPHGSSHDKLLVQKQPFLCQACHSISRHPGTTYAENPATPGSTTYQKLSNRAFYRGCLNCHQNVHGSNHPSGAFFMR